MIWPNELLALSRWALQNADLRYRFINADVPLDLMETPGIATALETSVVLAIYESALAKGYKRGSMICYEEPYPDFVKVNPKRSDLAFKDKGKGKNWAFVEVKRYGVNGKNAVRNDIQKLKSIRKKSQRWILCYRVKPTAGKSPRLRVLLKKHFKSDLDIEGMSSFYTVTSNGAKGLCEIVLARVK